MARRSKKKPDQAKGAARAGKARLDPRAQRREDRAARTQDAILEAAAEVMTRVGGATMTMDQVAQRAGYSVGSLYNYFKSKDALLQSMAVKLMHELSELLAAPLPASLTARQRVEALVLRQLEHVERSRGWVLALAQELPHPEADEVDLPAAEQFAMYDRVTGILAAHVRLAIAEGAARDLEPRVGAMFIAATVKGILLDWVRRGGEGSAIDLAPLIVSLVFDGIGPTRSPDRGD